MTQALCLAAAAFVLSPAAVKLLQRRAGWLLGTLLLVGAFFVAPDVFSGTRRDIGWTWMRDLAGPGQDVQFGFHGDALSLTFALLALGIGGVVLLYSAAYLHEDDKPRSFYIFMTGFALSVLILVLAADVVVLFVGWELVSIASFLLIAQSGSAGEKGASRTLILTFFGGLTLLAALGIAVAVTGTTNIEAIVASPAWESSGLTTAFALLIACSGFTKAAQFPFHLWLPEAMAAATPVSAFLHAAAVVKAGIYLLIRFSPVFAGNQVWSVTLMVVGMGTAIMSAFFAIQKTDLKKLTAYSTVSHLGWIVATIGTGAIAAAVVHTIAHALFKSSLFMLVGVVDHQAGSRDVRRLGSLWRRMPFTFGGAVLAAASMAAVPPLMGFVSKEAMLTAFEPFPLLLIAGAVGALLTFVYSTRYVFGAFVDGPRDMSEVREAPVSLWLPAALPGALSIVLPFTLGLFDAPLSAITGEEQHLALWHGVTVPFIISMVVLALGLVALVYRRRIWALVDDRSLFPGSGNQALQAVVQWLTSWGRLAAEMANSLSPTRHLAWVFVMLVALAGGSVAFGPPLGERINTDRWTDIIPLAIVLVSVIGLTMVAKTRLAGALLLGTAGVGATFQILTLGAPDVALTQFLVEILTVLIIMLAIRHQPPRFQPTSPRRKRGAAILAVLMGGSATLAVWALYGRTGRSELSQWYLTHAPDISGGDNVVNTILVEFRALDTLGELSVLGMAGVVIAAVVSSIPRQPEVVTRPFGFEDANAVPLMQLRRYLVPILCVLSLFIFLRGHNDPGGGFIAALVGSAAIAIIYLSGGAEKPVTGPYTPAVLTGVGMLVALASGYLGMTHGSFLYAIHGHILGEHVTTSMIFDAGVYLAVLGMIAAAINNLGVKK